MTPSTATSSSPHGAADRTARRPGGRSRPAERGSLCAFLVLLVVPLFALVGLAVDEGRAMSSQEAAAVEAEQAARAGAGQLSVTGLREGLVELDVPAAIAAAQRYTVVAGHPGTVTVVGSTVTVRVVVRVPTAILGIVGVTAITVSATASADNVHGVAEAD